MGVDTTPPLITVDEAVATGYCVEGYDHTINDTRLCTFECNLNGGTGLSGVNLTYGHHATYNTTAGHWNRPKVYCRDECDSNDNEDIVGAPTYEDFEFLHDDFGDALDGSIVRVNQDVDEDDLTHVDNYQISWYCEDRSNNRMDDGAVLYVIDTTPPTLTIGCGKSAGLSRYTKSLPGNGWRHNGTDIGGAASNCYGDKKNKIYHSAGYIKDLQIIYDLLSEDDDATSLVGWHCVDTCDHTDVNGQWNHVYDNGQDDISTIDGHKDNIAQWYSRPARCVEADSAVINSTTSIADLNASTPHNNDIDFNVSSNSDSIFRRQTMGFCNEVPGTYVVKYHCQDKSGNSVAQFQTIYNEDHIIPIIHVLGHQHMVLEATTQGNYVDDGAVCTDQIDGIISQNVEVSGDVVNLSKPGTYHIFYDCADSAGRIAHQRTRTVVVADCTCPTCDVFGDKIKTIEASFPYTDSEKANCTDSLYGSINSTAEQGNWNTWNGDLDVEKTGVYKITYEVCDDAEHCNTGNQSTSYSSYCMAAEQCPNENPDDPAYLQNVRTIHVVDTLKPVIALKYDNDYFHGVEAQDTGVGHGEYDDPNPTDLSNPANGHHTMAELTNPAVNGWLVGAVVSSITGLAILAYNRRTTVSTAVPV